MHQKIKRKPRTSLYKLRHDIWERDLVIFSELFSIFPHSETNWCKMNMFLYFTFNENLFSKDKTIFTSSCGAQFAK